MRGDDCDGTTEKTYRQSNRHKNQDMNDKPTGKDYVGSDDRVRMEAPEMFRVIGKRRPEFVKPYLEELRTIADTDTNRVVKIHCLGAVKATE